ncbi:MAG: hypothetical protein HY898_36500 [Deltaproteobacteria bacterium]|nr:hypothetical protein [Deltaproteobacteria bacterium]
MSLVLFLDLGDAITKGLAVGDGRERRLRYPSVVAHRLLHSGESDSGVSLDPGEAHPRPESLKDAGHPRFRSFPGAQSFVAEAHGSDHVTEGARFTGWIAAAYGADRQTLGTGAMRDNIEALARRALLTCGNDGPVEIVFVIDTGSKADEILAYAEGLRGTQSIASWSFLRRARAQLTVELRGSVMDAADCVVAAVPPEFRLDAIQRLLVIDIGYRRTKLVVVSEEGCEHVEHVDIGVSDCVKRIMRDGGGEGLYEDECALIRALEGNRGPLEVAGRSYDVKRPLGEALRGLEEEIGNAARKVVLNLFERRGEVCKTAAITGGGAPLMGDNLAAQLTAGQGPMTAVWVAPDPSFLLVEGARSIRARTPSLSPLFLGAGS